MKTGKVWLWLIPLTLFWPVMQGMVSLIRFGHLPLAGLSFSLVFIPMSLVSGIVFLLLWTRFVKRPQRIGILLGYALASPIALIGSLFSGLVYQSIVGPLLWGAVPLAIGMAIGLLVGCILVNIRPDWA